MTPKTTPLQTVHDWHTHVEGGQQELSYEDHHKNHVDLVSFAPDLTELVITCSGTVDIANGNGVVGPHRGHAPLWLFLRSTPLTTAGPGVKALVREAEGDTDLARLHHAMALIQQRVRYEVGASAPDWSAETALFEGRGVCQDHAHVMIAVARAIGVPARYVSGYLRMDDRIAQTAMHAWAEAHIDGLGWVGFDVSNQICPDTRYARVATGLDYSEAAPVTGTRVGGAGENLDVQIQVAEQ